MLTYVPFTYYFSEMGAFAKLGAGITVVVIICSIIGLFFTYWNWVMFISFCKQVGRWNQLRKKHLLPEEGMNKPFAFGLTKYLCYDSGQIPLKPGTVVGHNIDNTFDPDTQPRSSVRPPTRTRGGFDIC